MAVTVLFVGLVGAGKLVNGVLWRADAQRSRVAGAARPAAKTQVGKRGSNLGRCTIFKMPTCDPIGIVIIGFGILVAVVLMMLL
jgi:hypothetical protein